MMASERDTVLRFEDDSDEAIAVRLRAARLVAGYGTQKEFADALQINYQTYHSQEKTGRVSTKTVRFLYANHSIDYNFIFNGDARMMPSVIVDRLLSALTDAKLSSEQRPNSG